MNRRQFLHRTAALTALAALPKLNAAPPSPPGPLVGTQLYGWGQYYQRDGKKPAEHTEEILSAVRDCGYDYAETSLDSAQPENNQKLADQMKAKGLKPFSLYTNAVVYEDDKWETNTQKLIKAAQAAREAGFTSLTCDPGLGKDEKTEAQLKTQAKALELLGTELRKVGMSLGIHHHTPAMRSSAREYHSNFKLTAPNKVGFCYDVHWVFRGGVKPDAALKDYGSRIVSWHLRQSREAIWWEDLDSGDLDYSAIAAYAKKNNLAPFYTVELALENGTKITRSVVANHQRSRAYVKTIFGC
ncbi:MAG TPA: sugar phosphate isomerase/epimerase [Verrucomicrobiae bacterium]